MSEVFLPPATVVTDGLVMAVSVGEGARFVVVRHWGLRAS